MKQKSEKTSMKVSRLELRYLLLFSCWKYDLKFLQLPQQQKWKKWMKRCLPEKWEIKEFLASVQWIFNVNFGRFSLRNNTQKWKITKQTCVIDFIESYYQVEEDFLSRPLPSSCEGYEQREKIEDERSTVVVWVSWLL